MNVPGPTLLPVLAQRKPGANPELCYVFATGEGVLMDEQNKPLLLPAPSVSPAVGGRGLFAAVVVLLIVLLVIVAFAGGYGVAQWNQWQLQSANAGPQSEGVLSLPPELTLNVGDPPVEVRAETAGRRVMWMSLDADLIVTPYTPKSVWAWSAKPGDHQLIAWTAVNNLPTPYSLCVVKVKERKEPEKSASR
jgi:hypothetical protein